MKMVNLKLNNAPVSVPEGTSILEAARGNGIGIPTLCFLKDLNVIGACRVCLVEVVGQRNLIASCVNEVSEGMEIITNSKRVFDARRMNLELLLSDHVNGCLSCLRSGSCELQKLCKDYGLDDTHFFSGEINTFPVDNSSIVLTRDNNKCILCRRCVAACKQNQAVSCIGVNDRGFKTNIGCAFDADLAESTCVGCGRCAVVCPTGAITERDDTDQVWEALSDPTKHVIVQTAPSIRATLGEAFGLPFGEEVVGKLPSALRRLGFDSVFDTDFAADLTIMEEASEFLDRVKNGGPLPIITSCSPGWVKYCEHFFPDFIPNLSSCKSPQQMFGAIAKTWYAQQKGLDPKDIVMVSIMPCTAKKFEITRPHQSAAGEGIPDVDIVITTRELARMIDKAGLYFLSLPNEEFDSPLGLSTGAGTIFGVTGGVTEAALRTASEWLAEDAAKNNPTSAVDLMAAKELKKVYEFNEVRGVAGIKEATYVVGGIEVKVAVVSGLANAKELLTDIREGKRSYHFVEIMACPGGCINGGGQPIHSSTVRSFTSIRQLRASALYDLDAASTFRKSHQNPAILKLYDDFLGKPGGHKSHELLHTSYVKRDLD